MITHCNDVQVLQSDVISKWKKVELQNKLNATKKSTKKAKKVMLNVAAEKVNNISDIYYYCCLV